MKAKFWKLSVDIKIVIFHDISPRNITCFWADQPAKLPAFGQTSLIDFGTEVVLNSVERIPRIGGDNFMCRREIGVVVFCLKFRKKTRI